uniref:Ground-like domain-containing protein n=1 Tax=Parascaris univalens TaxID=6257 RepID=A0A915CBV8_PARUN
MKGRIIFKGGGPGGQGPGISHDCCFQCVPSSCTRRFHHSRRHKREPVEQPTTDIAKLDGDPSCNSDKLRAIMESAITNDTSTSKRNIQKAAEDAFKADFNVICAKGAFSYVSHTDTFCQISKPLVTCYAFMAF